MWKYLVVSISVLFLVSCNATQIPSIALPESSFSIPPEAAVERIMNHIDDMAELEYQKMQQGFSGAIMPCIGKSFIEYRQCVIKGLEVARPEIGRSASGIQQIDAILRSLHDEIRFLPHYQVLDHAGFPRDPFPQDDFKCHVVMLGGYQYSTNGILSGYTADIFLSYPDDFSRLVKLFPTWKEQERKVPPYNPEFFGMGESPCGWRTFGPTTGAIVGFLETETYVYLFIKDSDGAGSGEFQYDVIVYDRSTHSFERIGNFSAHSGVYPYPIVQYSDSGDTLPSERSNIENFFRNQPLLYTTYLGDMRGGASEQILHILETSVLEK